MADTEDYEEGGAAGVHHTTHEDGGSDEVSVEGLEGQLADAQPSTWLLVSGKPTTFTPAAHKTSHQDGGSDEISVAGLSGTLADAQTPAAHKTSHQDGGTDEISVQGLSGHLTDAQDPTEHHTSHEPGGTDVLAALAPAAHKTSHQDGGSDEISVQGLSGELADNQKSTFLKLSDTPSSYAGSSGKVATVKLTEDGIEFAASGGGAHAATHQDGGADEISVQGLAGLLADDQHVLDLEVINLVYPVGSIYVSVVATNPGTLFGVGTWVAFGTGRVLVGLDAEQTEFDTVEETGGEKTHVLITNEMPKHGHNVKFGSNATGTVAGAGFWATDRLTLFTLTQSDAGGDAAHNNLQPYIVVYMWKRTA